MASPAAVPLTFTLSVHDPLWVTLPPDRLMTLVPAVAVTVPPQVLLTLGVLDTTRVPVVEGSVSLKLTPVRSVVVLGLLRVKVSVAVPFSGIVIALNPLLMVGGATTVMLAMEVLPVPPSFEVTVTLLLFTPAADPVTVTLNAHVPLAVIVAPERAMVLEPLVVKVPPQTVAELLATVSPAGRLSVNATPVSVTVLFGLLMVKVSELVAFSAMLVGLNTLVMAGGAATVRLAEAVLPVPPLPEVTAPVVLVKLPVAVPFTSTVTVQLLLTAITPPVSDTAPDPALAVVVPPHVLFHTYKRPGSYVVTVTVTTAEGRSGIGMGAVIAAPPSR